MLLTESDIQRCQALAAAAFPRFTDWEFINEHNEDYSGFCLWGQYSDAPEESTNYFVTFDTFRENWRGHLSVGKHCYYWSSADVGDAFLLDTESCATLEEAIAELKRKIADLFAVLLASCA